MNSKRAMAQLLKHLTGLGVTHLPKVELPVRRSVRGSVGDGRPGLRCGGSCWGGCRSGRRSGCGCSRCSPTVEAGGGYECRGRIAASAAGVCA